MLQTLDGIQNGLRLSVTTPLEEVEAAAANEDVLVLEFDAFRDGRGFSWPPSCASGATRAG